MFDSGAHARRVGAQPDHQLKVMGGPMGGGLAATDHTATQILSGLDERGVTGAVDQISHPVMRRQQVQRQRHARLIFAAEPRRIDDPVDLGAGLGQIGDHMRAKPFGQIGRQGRIWIVNM